MASDQSEPLTVRFEELDPNTRRRLVARTIVQIVLIVALFMVAYYTLPWDGGPTGSVVVRLLIVMVAIIVSFLLALRRVVRSTSPMLAAIKVLAEVLSFSLVAFASTYAFMSSETPASFNEVLSRTDALYFTMATATTIGYGDIHPLTESARIVVMVQMVFNVIVLGVAARTLFNTARRRAGSA